MAGSDLITEARIVELGLTPGEIRLAVRQAIEQRADGRATLVGKVGLYPRSGGLFHAMPGALEDLVALKWLVAGGQPRPGDPELKSTILATDPLTGDLLGIMDAGYLTGLRTAAITALALELLVPRREIRLSFVGAGLQARAHLEAVAEVLPIEDVLVLSRSTESAQAFAEYAQTRNIRARPVADPREAIESADVVITCVPFVVRVPPFLDARWLRPQAFVALIDLGRPWFASTFHAFDRFVTDDLAHTQAFLQTGVVEAPGAFTEDLPGLVSGKEGLGGSGSGFSSGRTLFFPPGIALADAAVARLVLRRLGRM